VHLRFSATESRPQTSDEINFSDFRRESWCATGLDALVVDDYMVVKK
jgi:hypothetical protein